MDLAAASDIHGQYRFHVTRSLEAFCQLLFGQRDIDDYVKDNREVGSWNNGGGIAHEYQLLLKVLFPAKPSYINHCLKSGGVYNRGWGARTASQGMRFFTYNFRISHRNHNGMLFFTFIWLSPRVSRNCM